MKIDKNQNAKGRSAYLVSENNGITIHAPWFSGYAPASFPPAEDKYYLVVAHNIDDPAILCVGTGDDDDRKIPIGIHNIVVKDGSKTQTFRVTYTGRNNIDVTEITK